MMFKKKGIEAKNGLDNCCLSMKNSFNKENKEKLEEKIERVLKWLCEHKEDAKVIFIKKIKRCRGHRQSYHDSFTSRENKSLIRKELYDSKLANLE